MSGSIIENGDEVVTGDCGRSDKLNIGDNSGERLLCRCSSVGTSINSVLSAGSDVLWNIRISLS